MENESTLEINLKNAKSKLEASNSICNSLIKKISILESRASQFESTLKETMKARDELNEKLKIATEALEFECGNRCAHQNPCNARETLEEIKEKIEWIKYQ